MNIPGKPATKKQLRKKRTNSAKTAAKTSSEKTRSKKTKAKAKISASTGDLVGLIGRSRTDVAKRKRSSEGNKESSTLPVADVPLGAGREYDIPGYSDAQRMDVIKRLVGEGYGDRIVIAHDICSKHRLVRYGGHGYGHILENIVPRMRRRGLSEREVDAIVVENPARILALA